MESLEKRYAASRRLFNRAQAIVAVKNASFSIAENEFVALVGESGSGKSTIAKMLVGLEQPSTGRILLNGQDLTDPSTRSRALRAVSYSDGVPGPAVGAQSATTRGEHHHAGYGGRKPARELG